MATSSLEQQQQLRRLMHQYQLSRKDVAALVCQGRVHTVNAWLRNDQYRRNMPIAKLELLQLLLEAREKKK